MIVSAIAAVARNGVIGKDNQIPWYLPADLAWFKRTTLHRHVIMGRKSFESIGRPLPKRVNIVVTRNPFYIADGILALPSVEDALAMARDHGETEAFIIGGGEIYRQSMRYWDRIYLTEVDIESEGDAFFPEIDPNVWREISAEHHAPDEKNPFAYTFKILEKTVVSC
ncbi:MAG: type 3 dihydrofolate reductase [Saprospiraceae bacterium]